MAILSSAQDRLEDWCAMGRKQIPKVERKGFDSFVMIICWTIWKQWNARVFGRDTVHNVWGTVDLIFQELKLWAKAGGTGVLRYCE